MRRYAVLIRPLIILAAIYASACHAPATIKTDPGKRAYTADQIVQRLGEFQNAVIDAQRANKVKTEDARIIVQWLSGDGAQWPGAFQVLKTAPQGWPTSLLSSWNGLRAKVAAIPALSTWADIIDQLIQGATS
jgi:hypothetical protein